MSTLKPLPSSDPYYVREFRPDGPQLDLICARMAVVGLDDLDGLVGEKVVNSGIAKMGGLTFISALFSVC